MKRSSSRRRSPIMLGLVALLAGAAVATGAPTGDTPSATAAAPTWVKDYHYGFNASFNERKWVATAGVTSRSATAPWASTSPTMSTPATAELVLRTIYRNGQWSSAGVSGNPGFSAVGGKWEVRAKMPYAKGIGYAFLLMPTDGTWPPEVDIAEGRVNGRVEHFYH